MGFKLLNDLNVVERFELLERLERFELLEPPDHRLRLAREGPRTGYLGEGDQRRPGKGAEILRKICRSACEKVSKRVTLFDTRSWYQNVPVRDSITI